MCGELVGYDESPALSQVSDRWAEYRRLLSNFLGTKAKVDTFDHVLQEETNVYLKDIIADPQNWVKHTRRYASYSCVPHMDCYTC